MIYLDNHATTPCDPRVVKVMLPFFSERFANPSNEIHQMGRDARKAVEQARLQVAELVGAEAGEILFTGSATESNNLSILGLAQIQKCKSRDRIVTSAIEHKSILAPCHVLEGRGYQLSVLPVNNLGHVNEDIAQEQINENVLFVSIQAANNEIGTIQRIRLLCDLAHRQGVVFHCDAAQAVGKIPVDVNEWGVDLLSFSAHKMYGPKGIAALYIRGGASHLPLKPIFYGGDQEFSLRPGTLNVPLIVGFGESCRIASEVMNEESKRIAEMRNNLETALMERISDLKRNGDIANRLPNNSNLMFPGVDAEALIMSMPELMLSTGSACNSGTQEPSYVLKAIGLNHDEANSTLRIGLGRFNTDSEIITSTDIFLKGINALRQ